MPVTCSDGEWKVVRDLAIDEFSRGKMDGTAAELVEEQELASSLLSGSAA